MQTASELSIAIRQQQISALDALELFIQRINSCNKQLNAIVTLDADSAWYQARAADEALHHGQLLGPLHGVPITIKDSFDTRDMRTTAGYPPFSNRVPLEDALLVSRLRHAGAIIIGKTNLPTLASGIQTTNPIFGTTNNPWNPACTPGGSSGGSAAAIAAGLSALELGSDIGGSIRIPAHFCGIYGLKMTGQASLGKGHIASPRPLQISEQYRTLLDMASFGPLARSVDDLQLAFSVLTDHKDSSAPAASPRIAYTDDFGGTPITAETGTAMNHMANRLQRAGLQIECAVPPDLDFESAWELAGECLGIVNNFFQPRWMRWIRHFMGVVGSIKPNIHSLQRGLYRGISLDKAKIGDVIRRRDKLIAQLEAFFNQWDVWICPVFPTPAFTHRPTYEPIEVDNIRMPPLMANLLHSIIFNVSGHPAVVIPIGLTTSHLPIGVQIIGRRFDEPHLLDIARQIDSVLQAYRPPPEN